jgi:AcrR family transcriptional regulator
MREPTKTEQRHIDLRQRLIEIAEEQIAAEGAASLKARDLAARAGCSVGAIYNVVDDMTALVMEVNLRSFTALGAMAAGALGEMRGAAPRDQLIGLSHAYLNFATQNVRLWRALFDVNAQMAEVPTWYHAALADLFARIEPPVEALLPDLSPAERELMVRALFSAVHGIVVLGLQNPVSGRSQAELERMIAMVLQHIGN